MLRVPSQTSPSSVPQSIQLLPKFTLLRVDLLVCIALGPEVVKGSQGQLSGRDVVWIFRLSVHVQAYEGPYTARLSGK